MTSMAGRARLGGFMAASVRACSSDAISVRLVGASTGALQAARAAAPAVAASTLLAENNDF